MIVFNCLDNLDLCDILMLLTLLKIAFYELLELEFIL